MEDKERIARLCLSKVDGIGPIQFKQILAKFGNIDKFWSLSNKELRDTFNERIASNILSFKNGFDVTEYLTDLKKNKISYKVFGEESYPKLLSEIADPPVCLYYCGEWEVVDFARTIAIVGTRKMTNYGSYAIKKLTEGLSMKGFTVVSGLAFGVDACAQNSVINANGNTIAVIPGSPHKSIPAQNSNLYKKIIEGNGVVVSEYALSEKIGPGAFPQRNRIIAGLSLGIVVVEAPEKSGALITADLAIAENRQVFAIPGNINQKMSKGTNALIKNSKAKLIEDVEDILVEYGYIIKESEKVGYKPQNKVEEEIISILSVESHTIDHLKVKLSDIDFQSILTAISMMEISGAINRSNDGKLRLVV